MDNVVRPTRREAFLVFWGAFKYAVILAMMIVAGLSVREGDYARAAFNVSLAVFLKD